MQGLIMNKHPFIHIRPKNRRSLAAMALRVIEASIALGALWVTLFIGGGSTTAAFATVVDAAIFMFWMGREAASFCGMWLLGDIATYSLSGRLRPESVQEFTAVLEVARRKAHLCTTDSVEQLRQTNTPEQVQRHVLVRELANIWVSRTGEIKVLRRRTQIAQPELVPSILALFVEPSARYSVTHRGVRRT